MGIVITRPERPDIYGLPVYTVSELYEERVGQMVHLIHGHTLFTQTVWTHVEIWNASVLAVKAAACQQLAMRPPAPLKWMDG